MSPGARRAPPADTLCPPAAQRKQAKRACKILKSKYFLYIKLFVFYVWLLLWEMPGKAWTVCNVRTRDPNNLVDLICTNPRQKITYIMEGAPRVTIVHIFFWVYAYCMIEKRYHVEISTKFAIYNSN